MQRLSPFPVSVVQSLLSSEADVDFRAWVNPAAILLFRPKEKTMHQLLLASLLVLPAQTPQSGTAGAAPHSGRTAMAATSVEGSWTLVFGEHEGQPMKASNVMIQNNTLTFTLDGQQHHWRLNFGPRQTLQAWHLGEGTHPSGATGTTGTSGTATNREALAGAHHGVYILSGDYLCLSIQRSTPVTREGVSPAGTAAGRPAASGAGTAARTGAMSGPHQNRFFVMILQHQGGAGIGQSRR